MLPWGTAFLADFGAEVIRVESATHMNDRLSGRSLTIIDLGKSGEMKAARLPTRPQQKKPLSRCHPSPG